MQSFDYISKQRAFNQERRSVKQEYEDAMAELRADLKAKMLKLRNARDRKLDDIARREDEYIRQYRAEKQNRWMEENNHRIDNPEPKQP